MRSLLSAGLILLTFNLLNACAESVGKVDPAHLAPNGSNKGKEFKVAYNPSGFKELVEMRRKDALNIIMKTCGSNDYKILSETDESPSSIDGGIAMFGAGTARIIKYQCL